METVFQYRIPVLHPLMVHFPLALLLAAAFVALVWMFRGTPFWRQCLLLLLAFGTGGALAAYFTGEPMEEQSEGVPIVDALVELHETMGLLTLVASIVSLAGVAALTLYLRRRRLSPNRTELPRDPLVYRVPLALVVWLAAALVAWTAHIGGTMVWGVAR